MALVLMCATARAEAAAFVAIDHGKQRPLRYGRLMKTYLGPTLVLAERPHTCDEPFHQPGFQLAVPLEKHWLWFEDGKVCHIRHGTHSITIAGLRAVGSIDVPEREQVGGRGTFDVIVCPKPVEI